LSTTLYVRLPHRPHDQPQPWQFGTLPFALVRNAAVEKSRHKDTLSGAEVLREGHARISDLPAAERLVLILAASDVLLTTAIVPPLPPARLRLALPNLVEEALATDVQPCHIGVGPAVDADAAAMTARGPRRRLLMVADRAWLRAVLDAFTEHRHRRRHVVAAQLCLPLDMPAAAAEGEADGPAPAQPATLVVEAAAATALAQTGALLGATPASTPPAGARQWQLTVRTGPFDGYGLLLGDDALAAWQALAPDGTWYGDADAVAQAPVPALHRARPPGWRMWIEGAQRCLREPGLDLAQFEFAQGRAERWNLLAWRLPLALAAAVVLVQLLGMNVHWLLLHQEQKRLEAAQLQTLHGAFPQIQTVLDAPLQMRRQVEQLRLASGKSKPDDFLPLADRFAQAARQMPPDGLQALEYRGGSLVATLKPGTNTAAVRRAAGQAGLQMEEDKSPPDTGAGHAPAPAGTRWTIKPGL